MHKDVFGTISVGHPELRNFLHLSMTPIPNCEVVSSGA